MEKFTEILAFFSFILLTLIIISWFSSFVINVSRYKYYKLTYNKLITGKYVFNYQCSDTIYFKNSQNDILDEIIFFGDGSVKLANCDEYIHNSIVTFTDPYSTHWFMKLNQWKREFTLTQALKTNL